ncbi:glycoside hydrolase family 97 protein [Parasediminibacterium paludis]|uniref:Glycoside hydrolase family 97 protein n=1 Tax=Parasediminibacterium paludis TaxID=908966 RepID=A0ABV8PV85_9BACT
MQIKIITIFCCLFSFGNIIAQKNIKLQSPNGQIAFNLFIQKNRPFYTVTFKNETLVQPSSLNLVFDDGAALENCKMRQPPTFSEGIDDYQLIVGKTSVVKQPYKQAIIFFESLDGAKYHVNLEVKIFDDGLAFRYLLPSQVNKISYTLLEENTQFHFNGDPITKALILPNFTSSHEGLYTTALLSQIKEDTLMDMPALFQCNKNVFVGITEAALLNYAGMYLTKHSGILTSQLSPLPGQKDIKVKAQLPHQTPWRVMLISDRIGALIESNIITSLNMPCAFKETDWIKTGTTTFPWWNGTIVPDTSFTPGNNFETNKYYIDFCAENNILYHSVVEYGGHEWYTNDGNGYEPGPHADVTKPVYGLDMKQLCDYAKSKNVGVRVWVHWKALYPKIDTAFALFEKWGLSGMMVDFMDRDDQEMVNIQTEILQKAAAHHLHIQFHGAYKPTGLSRTYPNEFTREGTLNYECDKWNNLITPDVDINIPFTRMLAGSTDYHLGGFRAAAPNQFKVQYTRPLVMGTRCHMLAMYVVLENYQGMVCDYPDAYIGQPGFEVLQHIPTTWDETKVTNAQIDEYITIARRKQDNWYIGTISNNRSRELAITTNFLPEGEYSATIYSDAEDVAINPNHLTKRVISLKNNSIIKITVASGGGNVIILHKIK